MITTTLNRIRTHTPCKEGWEKLLKGLGKTKADDEPLPYATIIISNGLYNALWCCRAEPQYEKEWRLFAVACARRVENLNSDPRVKNAFDVVERYANGEATIEELNAAQEAARDAARDAAWHVARDAAEAARTAAWDAEKAAANAEECAAWAARVAADAARDTAAGAWNATWDAEREWQKQEFLRVVTETEQRESE